MMRTMKETRYDLILEEEAGQRRLLLWQKKKKGETTLICCCVIFYYLFFQRRDLAAESGSDDLPGDFEDEEGEVEREHEEAEFLGHVPV